MHKSTKVDKGTEGRTRYAMNCQAGAERVGGKRSTLWPRLEAILRNARDEERRDYNTVYSCVLHWDQTTRMTSQGRDRPVVVVISYRLVHPGILLPEHSFNCVHNLRAREIPILNNSNNWLL